MNLKRFPIKPNIGIATFLSIQIVMNYISRNLDVRSNVDFPVPNVTLRKQHNNECHYVLFGLIRIISIFFSKKIIIISLLLQFI